MLKKFQIKQNQKGFTLIELMIVIAIIGILAAIAIPQFAAYRIRGFNASAESDVRNMSTSEAAFFSDWQVFGDTQPVAPQNAVLAAGGNVLRGPSTPLMIIGNQTGNPLAPRGLNIGIGNMIDIIAGVDAASASFTAMAKHLNGDTAFGADSDTTALYSNATNPPVWIPGVALPGLQVAPVSAQDDFATAGAPWNAK